MKVYLAAEFSGSDGDIQLRMRRRLFSYWYHHDGDRPVPEVVNAKEKYNLDLFLDSGAFSAFTQKIEIKVEDYAAYWHNTSHLFTVASSLDAVGNAKQSYDNLKALEFNECIVQPVFHAREDPKWLVKYLDNYDYIFIGGMVPETTNWLLGWLDDLFTRYLTNADGSPRVKLHGFGLTDQQLMFRYPWYSVDSTSWIFTGVYGGCVFMTPQGLRKVVFSPHSPQAKKINAPHYRRLPPIMQAEVRRWLEPHNITVEQCEESYFYRHHVNARTFQDMESLACERFAHRSRGLFDD